MHIRVRVCVRVRVVTLGEVYSSRKLSWRGYIEMEYVRLHDAECTARDIVTSDLNK